MKPIGYLINDKHGFREFSPHPLTEADKRSDERFTETPVYTAPMNADVALAIGEHAFRAGYMAATKINWDRAEGEETELCEVAWSEYDPPEEIKELS